MSAQGDASLAAVGIIYQPQIHILTEAYQEYLEGLSGAKQFLHTLTSTERYASYVEVGYAAGCIVYFVLLVNNTTILTTKTCRHRVPI